MVKIDFDRIRSDFPQGQHGAFEELVCQLARRRAPSEDVFRRIYGAGGDGGIEGWHPEVNGPGKVGYQAKYFLRSESIDWTQLDASVSAALTHHADLRRYVIALPCDLTGPRNVARGKISQGSWATWERSKTRWLHWASERKMRVEFVLWTASTLRDRLAQPDAAGLIQYWFNETAFTSAWFEEHLQRAIDGLEERFHPEDHVDVSAQKVIRFVARRGIEGSPIKQKFEELRRFGLPSSFLERESDASGELLNTVDAELVSILAIEHQLSTSAWQLWRPTEWSQSVRQMMESIRPLFAANDPEKASDSERYRRQWVFDLTSKLAALEGELGSLQMSAERERALIVIGSAGSGKSHLFARIAQESVNAGYPAILLLGQQLRDGALWQQIANRLELKDSTASHFLEALDAAAAARRTRALILVDALNEGPGVRLWRPEISSFVRLIQKYRNIAVVLSCRAEYEQHLVPETVLSEVPRLTVRGFEEPREVERAAQIYLDRRGITRPATPWLAPEFTNPLFLRTCCESLRRNGQRQFPKGLNGTKSLLRYYLDSVARHLGAELDGANSLVRATTDSLLGIAATMAKNRSDYIFPTAADEIVNAAFHPTLPPPNRTWLDVLKSNGLLRVDPFPDVGSADVLRSEPDVLRFAFQRFGDHLMAEALLAPVTDIERELSSGGSLSFILGGGYIDWKWDGLIAALSIQIPERYRREFVDVLPQNGSDWWYRENIQLAFVDSVRWRSPDAFTERSLSLWNKLDGRASSPVRLLLEVAASSSHPWNAHFLHKNLKQRSMADRDTRWSSHLNFDCQDPSHPVHRLMDWCREVRDADIETIRLCAIVLTWLFTLSNRRVRDRATKALSSLLLIEPDIFGFLVERFEGEDEPYVWERLFAAAYGAASVDPNPSRLQSYSILADTLVFSKGSLRCGLLLRDYARGLVQLAQYNDCLPGAVDPARSVPPYGLHAPQLSVTKADVDRLAQQARDKSILFSCSVPMGDFGHYEVEYAVRKFTSIPLSSPAPVSMRRAFEMFVRECIPENGPVSDWWRIVEQLSRPSIDVLLNSALMAQWQLIFDDAVRAFESVLAPDVAMRFREEAIGSLFLADSNERSAIPRFEAEAVSNWVAYRAYELGGASPEFPWAFPNYDHDRARPEVERLGKKYQWIAFDELLCRLADNFWMMLQDRDAAPYAYPSDVGSLRDIDPTVFAKCESSTPQPWMLKPELSLVENVVDYFEWPFSASRSEILTELPIRLDPAGSPWVVAYERQGLTVPPWGVEADFHCEEIRLVYLGLVDSRALPKLRAAVRRDSAIDVHDWEPSDRVDSLFLLEGGWRGGGAELGVSHASKVRVPIVRPLFRYGWESQLDLSLDEGHWELVPSRLLVRDFGLRRRGPGCSDYVDESGVVRFKQMRLGSDRVSVVLEREWFLASLRSRGLVCVWAYVSERNSLGGELGGAWRRTEGLAWLNRGRIRTMTWKKDDTRRPTKRA